MQEIKLSILVPTYNHEKYIEECINGILMQKVDFSFEVLIGEDCSKDHTADVLRKMEPDLPSNFHIFYREKNMGIGDMGNLDDLILRSKGRYIAILEGDDFWRYDTKIQKQVDFLDAHPEYSAIAHNCVVVDRDSVEIGKKYTECKDEEYTFEHYINDILLGQTATVIHRREYYKYYEEFVKKYKLYEFYPGDRLKAFLLLVMGRVKCIQEPWSAYRYVPTEGSSYSATVPEDDKFKRNQLLFFKSLHVYAKETGKETAVIPSGKVYYMFLFKRCLRNGGFKDFFHQIFEDDNSFCYLIFVIKRGFRFIVKKALGRER